MLSFIKSIFNGSNVDAKVITDIKDEHENIENPEKTVKSIVTIENSNTDETMQVVIAKENILAEDFDNPEDVIDAKSYYPRIVLIDCMNEFICLKKRSANTNACLSDGKRIQRKCAKIAATKISKICWKLDEIQARSLDFKRSQHPRLCAIVAKTRIAEMVDTISPDSDVDDENEMSKAEMSEREMSEAEMSETEMSEAEMSESD